MASYTQIGPKEAEDILKLYGRSNVIKITPLSLGISNSNYRVDLENTSVLLKISNDKNQLQLDEVDWAGFLTLEEANTKLHWRFKSVLEHLK